MSDSVFYVTAEENLNRECQKLCDFTDPLDKDPTAKMKQIGEYKCAKYRYASISLIHSILYNNNRFRRKNSHHLLVRFDEILIRHADYLALYESATEEERPDYSLYYCAIAFADEEIEKLESKFVHATDWERIELEERIGGLKVAKECLDDAWQKRKDEIQ